MSTPKSSNEVDFSTSDFEGSDLSSLDSMDEHHSLPLNKNKINSQSNSSSSKRRSSNEDLNFTIPKDDLCLFSDTSSLTDIVSNWGSDKDSPEKASVELMVETIASNSLSIEIEKTTNLTANSVDHESSLSSLTSEENSNVKPKGSANRTKRLNLQSKLNLDRPNDMDRAGRTQLFRYAERGDLESCRKLLLARADVNVKDNAGWSPLHLACARGAANIVQLFIDNHANIHAPGLMRQTALHDAALSGSLETIRILIEAGADINARNLDGQSPLDICTQSDCLDYLSQQLEAKSSINKQNHEGHSRLHLACMADDMKTVTKLLDDGADVNVLNSQKNTPLHIAAQLGSTDIIAALIHRGALINTQDNLRYTALHFASENNHVMAVKLLLEHRCDPLISNYRNQMPLDLSDDEIVKSLIRDHIIQYSSRAMDMDRLLPRNNKLSVMESPVTDQFKSVPGTPVDEGWNNSPKKNGISKAQKIDTKRNIRPISKINGFHTLTPSKEKRKNTSSSFPLVKPNFKQSMKSNHKPPDIKVDPNSSPSPALSSFSPVHRQFRNKLPLKYVHPLDNYLNDSHLSKKKSFTHCQGPKHTSTPKDALVPKSLKVLPLNTPASNGTSLSLFHEQTFCLSSLSPGLLQTVRESIGFTPIYCVLLPSILNEGFLALDYQLQLFLRLTDSPTLIDKYPNIFRQKLTTHQKQLMWPPIEQMLKLNANPLQKAKQIRYKEFLRSSMNFIKWRDVLDIVSKDYSSLLPILENVAFDINYQSSVDCPAPNLPGDEGFPPSEIVIQTKPDINPIVNTVSKLSYHSTYTELDYIGPPEYVRRLTTFLQKHPELNPRPELPINDGIRLFISKKKHCLTRTVPYS